MTDKLIELRAWQQFAAVAEELHFTRAARRMHMTQPPMTQAIAQLEKNLGVQLFMRNRRHVALTATGAALLPRVQAMLESARSLPDLAGRFEKGEAGRVRLAFVSTVGFEQLPRWVRDFRQQFPQVSLELVEATGDVQLEAFAHDQLDAGLVLHSPGQAPPGLSWLMVSAEPLVLAVASAHPLATAARPTLSDVLAEPLVFFPRRILPSVHDAITSMYQAAGRSPDIAQEAIQMQTIVNLVSGGVGVAWVPRSVMHFQRSGVVYRLAEDLKIGLPRRTAQRVPTCETSLVWQPDSANAALPKFVEFVRLHLLRGIRLPT